MYVRVSKRVRARDQISMNRSMVGIPYLGARNPHCPEYPLIHEILVGIPSSGDSVQWGFRPVGIPGGNLCLLYTLISTYSSDSGTSPGFVYLYILFSYTTTTTTTAATGSRRHELLTDLNTKNPVKPQEKKKR